MNNMKHKILMTLALLLTAVGGAWAQDYNIDVDFASIYDRMGTHFRCRIMALEPGEIKGTLDLSVDGDLKGSFNVDGEEVFDFITPALDAGDHTYSAVFKPVGGGEFSRNGDFTIDKLYTSIAYNGSTSINMGVGESTELNVYVNPDGADGLSYSSSDASVASITKKEYDTYIIQAKAAGTATITFSFAGNKNYEAAEDKTITVTVLPAPIEVTPGETANQWIFTMPANDVELIPIYSAATIYSGETETPFETLKEAFANVKNGDVIKLDWNVTLTETLETPTIDGGAKFTLDFNGYTIDGGTTYIIQLKNAGDQLTFTDSSDDQLGGLIAKDLMTEDGSEFVFDAGRYNISGATAEKINVFCANASIPFSLAEGKEFIDLEGGAEANDGFTVRVGFKTFELAIGPKRFATFYSDMNIEFAEQPAEGVGLYTISSIDADRSTATVTSISGIIPANTPMLVYNGTEQKQTAKLIVTLDNAQDAITWAPQFKGTATDHEFTADDMAAADYYALSGGKAFAPVKGAGTLGANQCWLQFDKQEIPSARQFTLVFDETTGVSEKGIVDSEKFATATWYDLNGRKVAAPTKKGIYVNNGRKFVIK